MKYNLNDLKEGKVILQNSNEKICKKILKKVFNMKFKSYELPGSMYYYADETKEDGLNDFSIIERDAPELLHLPVVKSEKFKMK